MIGKGTVDVLIVGGKGVDIELIAGGYEVIVELVGIVVALDWKELDDIGLTTEAVASEEGKEVFDVLRSASSREDGCAKECVVVIVLTAAVKDVNVPVLVADGAVVTTLVTLKECRTVLSRLLKCVPTFSLDDDCTVGCCCDDVGSRDVLETLAVKLANMEAYSLMAALLIVLLEVATEA